MSGPARVLVLQPVYGDVPFEAASAVTQMIARESSRKTITGVAHCSYGLLSQARNKLVHGGLKTNATHFLLLDSDIVPPYNALDQLLGQDKDIVSALYFMRAAPHLPVAVLKLPPRTNVPVDTASSEYLLDFPESALVKVGAVGMGFVLIRRKVFEDIQERNRDDKWFSFENNEGEDIWFCRRAAEAGYSTFVDTGVRVGHVASVIITASDFERHHKSIV